MTTYRLYPSTNGPATATAASTNWCFGMLFKVTSTAWFQGFWWWVCPAGGQSTAAQKFVLLPINQGSGHGQAATAIPAATVTSGTLSSGWNFIPVAAPLLLTQQWTYMVTTAFANAFPSVSGEFSSTGIHSAGITNGPLFAFSDQGASAPDPFANFQCSFINGASPFDPAVTFPGFQNGGFNVYLDVQVTDTAPSGATYRLFPNLLASVANTLDWDATATTTSFTVGNTFSLSQPCSLQKMWYFSDPACTLLPSRIGIWDVGTQTVVSGTDNASPSFKKPDGTVGAAGNGWLYVDYSGAGITLPLGRNMIAAVFSAGGAAWRASSNPFWGTGGLGGSAVNVGKNGLGNGQIGRAHV